MWLSFTIEIINKNYMIWRHWQYSHNYSSSIPAIMTIHCSFVTSVTLKQMLRHQASFGLRDKTNQKLTEKNYTSIKLPFIPVTLNSPQQMRRGWKDKQYYWYHYFLIIWNDCSYVTHDPHGQRRHLFHQEAHLFK